MGHLKSGTQKLMNDLDQPNLNQDKHTTSVWKVQDWIKSNAAHQEEQENSKLQFHIYNYL